jgi:hypothetical protein
MFRRWRGGACRPETGDPAGGTPALRVRAILAERRAFGAAERRIVESGAATADDHSKPDVR